MKPSEPEKHPYSDGEALEVRVDAAEKRLDEERDREHSLNTRAVAVAAAAVVLMSLLQRPVVRAFDLDLWNGWHAACSGLVVLCCASTLLVSVLGVLRPTGRESLSDRALASWLEDDGMAEGEQEARFEILDAAVQAIRSRRVVNDRKASALSVAYGLLAGQAMFAAPVLVTLALR